MGSISLSGMSIARLTWWICLSLWGGRCIGQLSHYPESAARDWYDTSKYAFKDDPDRFLDEGMQLLNRYDRDEQVRDFAWASFYIGNIYRLHVYDYPAAVTYFTQSATSFVQAGDSIGLAFTLRNLGYCHNLMGKWALAENQLAESIRILGNSPYKIECGYSLNTMGNLQKSRGDFQRALGYLKEAKHIGEQTGELRLEAYAWNNMGTCYDEAQHLDSAYFAYQQSLKLLEQLGRRKDVASIWLNLARIAGARNQYDQALAHYEEALSIYRDYNNVYGQALIYSNLVHFWRDQQEWKKAEQYARANIALSERMGFKRNQLTGWRTLGAIYHELGKYDLCESYLTNSLKVASPDFVPTPTQPAPGAGTLLMPFESIHLLHDFALNYAAKAKQVDSLQLEQLALSAAYYRAAIDLIDTLRIRSFAKRSQAHVAAINYDLYPQAISISYQRYRLTQDPALLEDIWYISERSHNFLLFQAYEQPNPGQDSLTTFRHISLAAYQQTLKPDEATIVYLLGAKEVFGLKITADTVQLELLANRAQVERKIDSLNLAITDDWTHRIRCQTTHSSSCDSLSLWEDRNKQIFARIGHDLYHMLCLPLWPTPHSPSQLTLIADGKLQLLPFDILLSDRIEPSQLGHYRAYPYLIRAYQIAYGYDLFQPASRQAERGQVIGMAPFQDQAPALASLREGLEPILAIGREEWRPLPHSVIEMQVLEDALQGISRSGEAATKSWLLTEAPPFSILHISSHAYAHLHDPRTSFIAFTDTIMTLQQIQQQIWPADMVVLSACQTGLGRFQRGEGVISLGRAFHEAGAQSTLSTLWRVEDRATSEVIEAFYRALADGDTKASALRQARLAYLNQHDNRLSHPFFWGGWKLMGNVEPLQAPSDRGKWVAWLVGILMIVLAGGLVWRWGASRLARS